MTEGEAREQKRKIRVAKMPMTYVARALEVAETRGFMKAVVDAETNQILGAAVLGIEGGEIMDSVAAGHDGEVALHRLARSRICASHFGRITQQSLRPLPGR